MLSVRSWWVGVLLFRLMAVGEAAFDFRRDSLAITNGLLWEYRVDAEGHQVHQPRVPRPEFYSRCFAMARMTMLFHRHARFDPDRPAVSAKEAEALIRRVLARPARAKPNRGTRVVIPGFGGLRAFSEAHPELFQRACGGAWRSYFQRGHWRMVFPFTVRHQRSTMKRLGSILSDGGVAVVHVVRFPALTINHALMVYAREADAGGREVFWAYDPNDPRHPVALIWNGDRFALEANTYFAGGRVDVYPVYANAWN